MAGDLRSDDAVAFGIGAVMRERRIAAEHAAAMGVHHAAADRVIDLEPDLVETLQQNPNPPTLAMQCGYLAWFARRGNGIEAVLKRNDPPKRLRRSGGS